ncbi:MAG: ABC transporter permease subunit, partial [Planctomycetaceae bacterium]|nr:ABC transporter permease subunit [Planctomycetaceae bacterium]
MNTIVARGWLPILRQFIVVTLGLHLLSPLFAGEALERIRQRGTLIWGADQEGGGPFVYPAADDPSRLEGFEVEIAALLAEHLGVQPQFSQGQWDKLPNLVDRGDIDIVLNGYEWTPARVADYGVSIPYYIYELQLLGRKDDASLRTWGDLQVPVDGRPRRVSVLGGSAAEDYLRSLPGEPVETVSYDGATDAMRSTELGIDGLDANLQDLPVWTFFQSEFPALQPIGDPVGRGYYVVLTRKDEPELLRALNDALLAGLRDGRLRRIYERYRMWNRTQSLRALETNSDGVFEGDLRPTGQDGDAASPADYIPVRGWDVITQRGGLLVRAAGMTVALSVVSMPLAILAGLLMTLLRLYGPRLLGRLATLYVELVRGTPLVLQLYVIFFLLPEIGISVPAFWAAVIGLAINYSAYEAEIYRAGIQAIPHGQMEAAYALGMTRSLAIRRVI